MFLTFFIFSGFLIFYLKTSKANYEYAKIQRETLLEDASAMIFIDYRAMYVVQSVVLLS